MMRWYTILFTNFTIHLIMVMIELLPWTALSQALSDSVIVDCQWNSQVLIHRCLTFDFEDCVWTLAPWLVLFNHPSVACLAFDSLPCCTLTPGAFKAQGLLIACILIWQSAASISAQSVSNISIIPLPSILSWQPTFNHGADEWRPLECICQQGNKLTKFVAAVTAGHVHIVLEEEKQDVYCSFYSTFKKSRVSASQIWTSFLANTEW